MKKSFFYFTIVLFLLSIFSGGYANDNSVFHNVLDYGAVNDGSAKITDVIKKAIETATEAGGGTIYFPPGEYLTGPIHLKSNITLYIDAGATIKFSDDFDDYLPMVKSRWEGTNVINFSPLIYAYEAKNIAIRGRGTIDGQGQKWWEYWENLNAQYRKTREIAKVPRSKWQDEFAGQNEALLDVNKSSAATRIVLQMGYLRPPFIQPLYCKNFLIEGITIVNSPFWTVNPQYCENVTVTGVTINNSDSPNTDGINPSSCKYVHISNCHINVGDDCITIKSGRDEDGRKTSMPAEDYTITNCTMLAGHGGVVIGSEMSGDVRKITISNCVFDGTDRGIRIKSTRGRGGIVEEIRISNVVMKNIMLEAIKLNMHYHETPPEPVSERTPRFRNIHLSNITAQAKQAGFLLGLGEMPIEGITFNDINITSEIGFTIKDAKNIEFHNVQINTSKGPAIVAENTRSLEIDRVKTLDPHSDTPVIELKQVEDVFIHDCFPGPGTVKFVKADEATAKTIVYDGNNFKHVAELPDGLEKK